MYEKKKKLDVESEESPEVQEEASPPKKEKAGGIFEKVQQSLLSNQGKSDSSGEQELANRLNLINQSLKKLDI